MSSRNITKALIGLEDLLVGLGNVSQMRAGQLYELTKLDIAAAVMSVTAMQALDVTKYHRARVYASESNYAEYIYDSSVTSGISSNTGPGTWLPTPSFARTLSVEDKLSMRLVEPSFNLQLAIALGATALGVGFGSVYYYDEDSTAPDDGDNVLVTSAGARWLKVTLDAQEFAKVKTAGGGANALTASFGFSTVPQDQIIWLRATETNTGEVTFDPDGIGPFPVLSTSLTPLIAGAIEQGKVYALMPLGSSFILINPSVSEIAASAGTDNFGSITALRLSQVLSPIVQNLSDLSTALSTGLSTEAANRTTAINNLARRHGSAPWLNGIGELVRLTGSGTFTVPSGVYSIKVRLVGGGGGGGGSGDGDSGTSSTFDGMTATGGSGGLESGVGGAGATAGSSGTLRVAGGDGGDGIPEIGGTSLKGPGGTSYFGGSGAFGSGGKGAAGVDIGGGGGGAGRYIEYTRSVTPGQNLSYTVGSGGSGGGSGGGQGQSGTNGTIIIEY